MAWAREGAPAGAVVVADFQLAPRGRAGLEWHIDPERDVAFSAIFRPTLAPQRDAWPFVVGTMAVADALAGEPTIRWPDEVWREDRRAATVGVQVDAGPTRAAWVVVSVWIVDPSGPRADVLARVVAALEERFDQRAEALLEAYRRRCATLDRRIRVRMSGMGAGETVFEGVARAVLKDGTLIVQGEKGRQMVPPSYLRVLEELD